MEIPKIIHYCWFGPNPIPELELRCMATWKSHFPDYEFKFWNEKSFDLDTCQFAKEAFEKGYFAFVSDYVRAEVLFKYGGIYLDTDLEILKSCNTLLDKDSVILGFENQTFIGTAIMASIPKHEIFEKLTAYYQGRTFVQKNGDVQIVANPSILKDILSNYGIAFNNTEQSISGIHIYPRDYFFPKKLQEGKFRITDRTYTIHHFGGSWLTDRQKRRGENKLWIEVCRPLLRSLQVFLMAIIGKESTNRIEHKIRNWLK